MTSLTLLRFDDGFFSLVLFQQLLVVLVVLEVFETSRRPLDHAYRGQAFEQRAAQRDWLPPLQEAARGQRSASFQHELLRGCEAFAARQIARRQACAGGDELTDDDVLLQAEQLVD